MSPRNDPTFDKARHIKYWKRNADLLPEAYTSGDAARMSLGFFIVAALDLLGVLDTLVSEEERIAWIDWIYSLQVPSGGFRGFSGTNLGSQRNIFNLHWDPANLHNTYMGLVALLVLGDDLGRVKRTECLRWVKQLQKSNGCFGEMVGEDNVALGKDDLRSSYCAAGIIYILGSETDNEQWLDKEGVLRYVSNCQDTEGAFGQAWLREAHAGLNFCAMATLGCLDRIYGSETSDRSVFLSPLLQLDANLGWMLQRQTTWVDDQDSDDEDADDDEEASTPVTPHISAGFSGRCNKMADTCYCFWNVGAMALLRRESLVGVEALKTYLFGSTQHLIGGFSKTPGAVPDLLHAYTGLAALSVVGQEGLKEFDPVLCVSRGTRDRLDAIRRARAPI
ncbi:uncharacterized protein HMPREF1541_06546 [Cyphellophora europaea CBS 101466]|uniref:Prenyltransferase alpha-alpha toroid domain-containing protein n=1 Tax=Cyphellophora europaea (strain CBS 101466) TaxID=1220924 RepID=W2RPR9_CYPE1|nr:uncharacterized protein HMPREF1541_06546 [Cyphellophora europaea CBS 101466]ETN38511.1 hypothetical protein HMPREF1541_06546 [Cyphellophora europaea CBS 101466]